MSIHIRKAPWTEKEVENLNKGQQSGLFHPYTCGSCGANLEATTGGWICSESTCAYTQNWAHTISTFSQKWAQVAAQGDKE